MNVILESEPGDELICVTEFSASPEGTTPSWETMRTFRVGDRVRYVDYYQDQNLKDNPVCWMVLFDAADGRRYSATQSYFVTIECWDGLKRYLARRLLKEPVRSHPPTPPV
jgi:hypothetical protein